MSNFKKQKDIYSEVIKRSWSDDGFKQSLKDNPKKVLGDYGLNVPEQVEIVVIENTKEKQYLLLPDSPRGANGDEMTDEELNNLLSGNDADQNLYTWNKADCRFSGD